VRKRRLKMEQDREDTAGPGGAMLAMSSDADLWRDRDAPQVKEELLRRHMDFAKGIALKFSSGPEQVDDLIQVAYLGLVQALERFDPDRGIPFQAFASPTINGELKRHFRDRTSQVRIPRSLYERISEVDSVTSDLSAEMKRTPTVSEIAKEMDTQEYEVLEAIEAKHSRYPVSLEGPSSDDSPDLAPADRIGEEDGSFEEVADHLMLVDAAAELSEREREVLRLRFREEMTQSEIAERIGHSQMHVSRILRRTLETLRNTLPAETV
jgi:RNA polymerase sigma-B factor